MTPEDIWQLRHDELHNACNGRKYKLEIEKKREIDLYHRDGSVTGTIILAENEEVETESKWIDRCGFTRLTHKIGNDEDQYFIKAYGYTRNDEFLVGTYYVLLDFHNDYLEVIAKDQYAVLEFMLKYKPLLEG